MISKSLSFLVLLYSFIYMCIYIYILVFMYGSAEIVFSILL